MKLSDAILKGAEMRPQGYQMMFSIGKHGMIKSCAIGAAYEGFLGKQTDEEILTTDTTTKTNIICDAFSNVPVQIWGRIVFQNDTELRTREEIAAWLKELGL